MKKLPSKKDVIIYQAKNGAIELRGDFTRETVWATQAQIADVFNIDRTVATKHIANILKIREVDQKSNVQKMHIANSDKPVAFYSLDIMLAVGYRANSAKAIDTNWPDGCLGVKEKDTVCTQVITSGYDILMQENRKEYRYRTNTLGSVVKAENWTNL